MTRYVIVAFKVSEENSIYYKKCKNIEELKRALETAFEVKNADFVSIRRVVKPEKRAPTLKDLHSVTPAYDPEYNDVV